ncbi:MAG: hypothetical protein GY719_25800 [bacterium]|nr:hypothetical protein [bacterium]
MEPESIAAAALPSVLRLAALQERTARLWKRRREALQALGFKSYDAYQESEHWAEIRERVFRRDHQRCRFCGAAATQVHHDRYDSETLSGASLRRLLSVCGPCHQLGSLDADGNAREPAAATRYMREINPPKWFRRRLSRAEILRLEDLRLALGEGEARRAFWQEVIAEEPRPKKPAKRKRPTRKSAGKKEQAAECERQLLDLENRRKRTPGGVLNRRAKSKARKAARAKRARR